MCSTPVLALSKPASRRRRPGWGCRCRDGSATPWSATPGSADCGRRSAWPASGFPPGMITLSSFAPVRPLAGLMERRRSRACSSRSPRGLSRVRPTGIPRFLRSFPPSPATDESQGQTPVGGHARPRRRCALGCADPHLSAVVQPAPWADLPVPANLQRLLPRVPSISRRCPRQPPWPAADLPLPSVEPRGMGSAVSRAPVSWRGHRRGAAGRAPHWPVGSDRE